MFDPIARRRARRGVVQPVEPSSAPWRLLEPSEPEAPATQPGPRDLPWRAIAVSLVVAAVAIGAFLLAARSDPPVGVDGATGIEAGSADPGGLSTDPAPGTAGLVVEVGGAVVRPGVYRLPPGSRIGDAIAAAGGFGPRVDAAAADTRLNLAAPLTDGGEVHVPSRDEAPSTGGTAGGPGGGAAGGTVGGRAGGTSPTDLNTASAEQLDLLPGIGPATAAKIIAAREERRFASVDDLRSRKVVGEATLEKIRSLVTVGP